MTTEHANPLAGTRLAFIGAGVMAESMIAGILKQGQATPGQIIASHPRPERLARLEQRFGIETADDESSELWIAVRHQFGQLGRRGVLVMIA